MTKRTGSIHAGNFGLMPNPNMPGLPYILSAAVERGLTPVILVPHGSHLRRILPGDGDLATGCFVMINDDPASDKDASQGPSAFDQPLLRNVLEGSQAIVCSGAMGHNHGVFAAMLVALAPVRTTVMIITGTPNHAAWTKKVIAVCGREPVLHIVEDGTGPEDWGADAVELPMGGR